MVSVSQSLMNAGYSWSASGKDRDNDGKVTCEEFMLPVAAGQSSLVPADLKAGGSLEDMFKAYDANGDGVIDKGEIARGARSSAHAADRFSPDWAKNMRTEQALAYFNVVNRDNAALVQQWGLKA